MTATGYPALPPGMGSGAAAAAAVTNLADLDAITGYEDEPSIFGDLEDDLQIPDDDDDDDDDEHGLTPQLGDSDSPFSMSDLILDPDADTPHTVAAKNTIEKINKGENVGRKNRFAAALVVAQKAGYDATELKGRKGTCTGKIPKRRKSTNREKTKAMQRNIKNLGARNREYEALLQIAICFSLKFMPRVTTADGVQNAQAYPPYGDVSKRNKDMCQERAEWASQRAERSKNI